MGTWVDGVGIEPGTEGGIWYRHCAEAINACFGRASDVTQVWIRVCPDVVLTVGAVLGWAAYIEVVFTLLIISPLYLMGCIQNGKHSTHVQNMKGWIQEDLGLND